MTKYQSKYNLKKQNKLMSEINVTPFVDDVGFTNYFLDHSSSHENWSGN